MADARGFRLELERFLAVDVKRRAVDLQKQVTLAAFVGITDKSPVGEKSRWKRNLGKPRDRHQPRDYVGGHFRKNWQLQVGSKPAGEIAGTDPSGGLAQARAFAELAKVTEIAPSIWIVNHAPYAEALENGWSRQAPSGMVAITVGEINGRFGRVS